MLTYDFTLSVKIHQVVQGSTVGWTLYSYIDRCFHESRSHLEYSKNNFN